MAINLVHLIAYWLQRLGTALQRHDWFQQIGVEFAPLDHAAEAITAASLEWWLGILILELIGGFVPCAPKYVAPSAVSFIPGPLLDVASHVIRAIRSQAAGAAGARSTLS